MVFPPDKRYTQIARVGSRILRHTQDFEYVSTVDPADAHALAVTSAIVPPDTGACDGDDTCTRREKIMYKIARAGYTRPRREIVG